MLKIDASKLNPGVTEVIPRDVQMGFAIFQPASTGECRGTRACNLLETQQTVTMVAANLGGKTHLKKTKAQRSEKYKWDEVHQQDDMQALVVSIQHNGQLQTQTHTHTFLISTYITGTFVNSTGPILLSQPSSYEGSDE
jgi:hypothetical protein